MNNKTFTQEETYKLGFENRKNAAKEIVLAKSIMIKDSKVPSIFYSIKNTFLSLFVEVVEEIEICEFEDGKYAERMILQERERCTKEIKDMFQDENPKEDGVPVETYGYETHWNNALQAAIKAINRE